jgi:hypothetical protein
MVHIHHHPLCHTAIKYSIFRCSKIYHSGQGPLGDYPSGFKAVLPAAKYLCPPQERGAISASVPVIASVLLLICFQI